MKKLVRVGLIVAALGATALGGGMWWVKGQFSREAVERQLQAVCAGRVTLGASELELWSSPARWRLRDLQVHARAGRDGQAEPPKEPVLSLEEAVLEVALADLISGTLDVRRLNLTGLSVEEYVSPEGVSDLQGVLAKPVAQAKVTVVTEEKPEAEKKPKLEPGEKAGSTVFKAEQLGLTLRVREARLSRGRLYIHNRVNKTKTRLEDLSFALTEIDIDPANLAAHNQAGLELAVKVTMEGRGKVDGEMRDVTFAKLDVNGRGKMQPFHEETGEWSPVSDWELTLAKGSVLAGYMTLGQADADVTKKVKDFGLDISGLPMGGELLEPAVLKMAFSENRFLIREDARFQMPEYEVRMAKDSWLNSAEDAQDLVVRMVCGEKLDKQLSERVLASGIPEKMAGSVLKAFQDEVVKRLAFDLRVAGKMTRPDVKPAWDKALERLLKDGGGLDGLLKGLIK